ncbi:MAG: hypothetical protein GY913_24800 [Proteobacteria bacterium]|nr:hypothetical protein [Pseudomonadota bacterium]MCP4920134.1 hypothetical protein [Pseudomonadota bacterium]
MGEYPSIFKSPSIPSVSKALVARWEKRLDALELDALADLVADTVYKERLRFEDEPGHDKEVSDIDAAAKAISQRSRSALCSAVRRLVRSYAHEIHHPFSTRAYGLATRVLPSALTNLVTASDPRRLLLRETDPGRRIAIHGDVDQIKRLAEKGTLILAPTHLSNLDSPLIGYVLFNSGLPPFSYGAGLNLFSNPMMAFWMSRLGAYTVDRRKRGRIYKQTLKDYSTEILRRGCHSLFFPGGTRSRSGRVEHSLKKGLLGTGVRAWQEQLAERSPTSDVFVVPLTLSTSLVLEAETLVRDSLSREGKSRYIIVDDEFSQPRRVASYLTRVANLDESVHVTFGTPLDVMGNPVDADGNSLGPDGEAIDRKRYVCNDDGQVEWDDQRDQIYTQRLSKALVRSYHRDNVALPTHVAALAAWRCLARQNPGLDTWRLVRVERSGRQLDRAEVLQEIQRIRGELNALRQRDRIRTSLPGDAEHLLETAIQRFGSYHSRPAIEARGQRVDIDPELCLFYRNRLHGYGLEGTS